MISGAPLHGPFLTNVVKTFKREQLAESILLASKSLAQGFVTNVFVLDDRKSVTGFVTNEAADAITLRDAEGKEIVLPTSRIEERAGGSDAVLSVWVDKRSNVPCRTP